MPIAAADLIQQLPANAPEDDTSTAGGARSAARRPLDSQWAANAVAAVVSDGADTRTVTVEGRLATGAVDTEVLVLNGTTEVVGAKTWERILNVTLSAADATRTVTLRQGAGGTTRHTFNPNETFCAILFQRSASEGSIATRYEKVFWLNNHGTLSLLSATVKLTADPAAKIEIGVAAAVDDTVTVANRKTAPASITFVDDNVAQSVPGTDLAAAAAIGVWIKQVLAANDGAQKTTLTTELAGSST